MCLAYSPFEWTEDDVASYVQIANTVEQGAWSIGGEWEDHRTMKTGRFFLGNSQNEENNPMLQLNLRLGFRKVHAYVLYRKEL